MIDAGQVYLPFKSASSSRRDQLAFLVCVMSTPLCTWGEKMGAGSLLLETAVYVMVEIDELRQRSL